MSDDSRTGANNIGEPPGWYPDPWQHGGQRWWNGLEWTDRTSSGDEPSSAQVDDSPDSGDGAEAAPSFAKKSAPLVALLAVLGAIALGLLYFVFESPEQTETADAPHVDDRDTLPSRAAPDLQPEEQLALLFDNSEDSDVIRSYRIALNAAESVCTQTRQGIADVAYRGSLRAEEQGVDLVPLEILQSLSLYVPREERPVNCATYVDALILIS